MHIPDGFVNAPTALATGAVSLGAVTLALNRAGRNLGERTVPLLGVTAAFVFAAQMLNFPVAAGTSGHFLGAVLAAVLIGPWSAVVVMTVVLAVQAVGMADGGITALGANVFNMGVVAGLGGYLTFRVLKAVLPRSMTGYFAAVAASSWLSVVVSAAVVSLELAASGTVPLSVSLAAMTSVHMIIGLGEALITSTVLAAVLASRPDLVSSPPADAATRHGTGGPAGSPFGRRGRPAGFVLGAVVVALALAVLVAPFASSAPDGLERVAADKGFGQAAREPIWRFSPLTEYSLPGIADERLATSLAGLLGVVALLGVILLVGRAFGRSRPRVARPGTAPDLHPMAGHEHTDHRHSGHTHRHHVHVTDAPGTGPDPDHLHEKPPGPAR